MRTPDYYEFSGLLAPGSLVLIWIILKFPEMKAILMSENLSFGGFGLFLIMAFIAGHIIQALGNILENAWWYFQGGMPSYWIVTKKSGLILSENQKASLQRKMRKVLNVKNVNISNTNKNTWGHLVQEINAYMQNRYEMKRLIVFNGNYGLNRGLTAGFLIVSLYLNIFDGNFKIGIVALICALLSLYRMQRFAIHYAKELYTAFLECK